MINNPDFSEVKQLFAENEELTKLYQRNNLIHEEFQKRIEDLRRKIVNETHVSEIGMIELKEEKDITLRIKKLHFKKPDEYKKVRECTEEVHEMKEKIIQNASLEARCMESYNILKDNVKDLETYIGDLEASNKFQSLKIECKQLENQINEYVCMEKEKKDELMRLSLEYLHPSKWQQNLIKLIALRKKKLFQQCGFKIIRRNNKLLEEGNISEIRRQKIQHLNQKIFDDLRHFDKVFGINDFIPFAE
uniref:Uncharacterized protein n=1 Tax=Strongyloides venezuelensis TaxID=75913 RepID=A0A0K0F5X0_STRVS